MLYHKKKRTHVIFYLKKNIISFIFFFFRPGYCPGTPWFRFFNAEIPFCRDSFFSYKRSFIFGEICVSDEILANRAPRLAGLKPGQFFSYIQPLSASVDAPWFMGRGAPRCRPRGPRPIKCESSHQKYTCNLFLQFTHMALKGLIWTSTSTNLSGMRKNKLFITWVLFACKMQFNSVQLFWNFAFGKFKY